MVKHKPRERICQNLSKSSGILPLSARAGLSSTRRLGEKQPDELRSPAEIAPDALPQGPAAHHQKSSPTAPLIFCANPPLPLPHMARFFVGFAIGYMEARAARGFQMTAT